MENEVNNILVENNISTMAYYDSYQTEIIQHLKDIKEKQDDNNCICAVGAFIIGIIFICTFLRSAFRKVW